MFYQQRLSIGASMPIGKHGSDLEKWSRAWRVLANGWLL
jgi:hypothetical protein